MHEQRFTAVMAWWYSNGGGRLANGVLDMNGPEWLDNVLKEMNDDAAKGKPQEKRLTVREFIRKFGYARRGP